MAVKLFATICFWQVQKMVRSSPTMTKGIRMSQYIIALLSCVAASMPM